MIGCVKKYFWIKITLIKYETVIRISRVYKVLKVYMF